MNLVFPLKKNTTIQKDLIIDKKTLINTKLSKNTNYLPSSVVFNNNVDILVRERKIKKNHIRWDLFKNKTMSTYSKEEYDRSIDHNQILINRIKKARNQLQDEENNDNIKINIIHRPPTVMHEFSFQR